jgi:ABC-type transport system involved in cytochrome c biogenesis permease subunit
VVVQLHQLTAALYLVAALVASLGAALPAPRLARASLILLAIGVVAHGLCFAFLHTHAPTPALTQLPVAVSFMAWVATGFYLVLAARSRLAGLVVLVAPLAFVSVFVAGLRLPEATLPAAAAAGSWEHAHVLLASAGLALLGMAGVAGVVFLVEHRRLKQKRPIRSRFGLPSLEALDRVNAIGLGLGFPLLTLGVITGVFWVERVSGKIWTGTTHELWSVIAWAIYAVVAVVRFTTHQGGRQSAVATVGGFVFLFFAVIGLGWIE